MTSPGAPAPQEAPRASSPPSSAREPLPTKHLVGYLDEWARRAGESVTLKASHTRGTEATVSLARIVCGDATRYGPGFREEPVALAPDAICVPSGEPLTGPVAVQHQPLVPGSYASCDLRGWAEAADGQPSDLTFGCSFTVTGKTSTEPQPARLATLTTASGIDLFRLTVNTDGVLTAGSDLAAANSDTQATAGWPTSDTEATAGWPTSDTAVIGPLERRRWYTLLARVNFTQSTLQVVVTCPDSPSPGRDAAIDRTRRAAQVALQLPESIQLGELLLAAGTHGERYDGKVGRVSLSCSVNQQRQHLTWDFGADPASRSVPSSAPDSAAESSADGFPDSAASALEAASRPFVLHQLPTRATPGPAWTGEHHDWRSDPSHYDAVHFHRDDLYDAGWNSTATIATPTDLPSGIYAVKVTAADGEVDRVPFFVRPASGAPTADVALLMPTFTYLAYADHRMLFEGADYIAKKTRLRPEHAWVRDHPEVGLSTYEEHSDGSGVMFSSRLRPVLHTRPGADGWNFTPDTDINAFLTHTAVGHDVITDDDLHVDGLAALEPYRVLVTGSHPEYWSSAMSDALAEWQRRGGRLMYLGGNGFYWRVATSDAWPGAIELRRAEDGVRNWQTEPGENYHAFGGEYGGLWRRLGRPPNALAGIGFAAQGFERATHYDVDPEARASRAGWILEGVDDNQIGSSGLGGGAAGQEVDRFDIKLGSPPHAVVLASATDFGDDMLRTKEEFGGSVWFEWPDHKVRADMVFYETPNGGAVFSVGSISWFGALARNGYDNDVARITSNVLLRFADAEPFEAPSG